MNVYLVSLMDPNKEIASGIRSYVMSLLRHLDDNKVDVKIIGVSDKGGGDDFIPLLKQCRSSASFLMHLFVKGWKLKIPKNACATQRCRTREVHKRDSQPEAWGPGRPNVSRLPIGARSGIMSTDRNGSVIRCREKEVIIERIPILLSCR